MFHWNRSAGAAVPNVIAKKATAKKIASPHPNTSFQTFRYMRSPITAVRDNRFLRVHAAAKMALARIIGIGIDVSDSWLVAYQPNLLF